MDATAKRQFKAELFEQFARIGRALASPARLAIIELLAQSERRVEDVAREIGTSVANASQHLQRLRAARLVDARREGLSIYYRVADERVVRVWLALRELGEARYAEVDEVVRTYLTDRGTMETVRARELLSLLRRGEVVVLDVRTREEFAAGHIPAARSIPLGELKRRLKELPRRRRVVAYCRGPYCVFSDEAVAMLRRNGFRAARLEIGLPDWKLLGLPVET